MAKERTAVKKPKRVPPTMATVVVGGCADGVLINEMRTDAQWIELARPAYVKPLSSSIQKNPEVVKDSDKYEVHPVSFTNTGDTRGHVYGIAVVEGQTLTWAFTQLVIGYVENTTNELLAKGLIEKQ